MSIEPIRISSISGRYQTPPIDLELEHESPPTLDPSRRWGYVYRNYERIGVSRPTETAAGPKTMGLPDTTKLVFPDLVELTRAHQEYWFGLLKLRAGGRYTEAQLKTGWGSLITGYRAFTNKHGPDNGYADYINNVNTDSEGVKFETIITGGNIVEILGDPVRVGGQTAWPVNVVSAVPDINEVNYAKTPWLVFYATISRREGYNAISKTWANENIEIPFPQLGGLDVPVPLFSKRNVNFIEVSRMIELSPGSERPNPYHPPLDLNR